MRTEELTAISKLKIDPACKRVNVVVSDIDGCLNLDERTYQFDALTWVRTVNRLASSDNPLPHITVCSGRPLPFVEAICRLIAADLPAIFENGCGMFFPVRSQRDAHAWHPSLERGANSGAQKLLRDVLTAFCETTGATRAIGKEMLVTLYPQPPISTEVLADRVRHFLDEANVEATVVYSRTAVDISPVRVDKAAGVRWLISELNASSPLQFDQVAGIGDSNADLPFLALVGFSGAPANAVDEVRAAVDYCSPHLAAEGVVDFIKRCIEANLHVVSW